MKSEAEQISLTDPDARSMATGGKDTGIVGYNVQIAVDTRHHLIVAHEMTNVGTDRDQLSRDDPSLPSFRARLSQATGLPSAVVRRGRTCSDVSFSSLNPARCRISTRFRREACRAASVLSRHENCPLDEHCG